MFHKSNYGVFGGNFPCDMNGYVPEAGDSPWAGAWDHTEATHDGEGNLTDYGEWWEEEGFPAKVAEAEAAKADADAALDEWRVANS